MRNFNATVALKADARIAACDAESSYHAEYQFQFPSPASCVLLAEYSNHDDSVALASFLTNPRLR
jgi:hypothetical protein